MPIWRSDRRAPEPAVSGPPAARRIDRLTFVAQTRAVVAEGSRQGSSTAGRQSGEPRPALACHHRLPRPSRAVAPPAEFVSGKLVKPRPILGSGTPRGLCAEPTEGRRGLAKGPAGGRCGTRRRGGVRGNQGRRCPGPDRCKGKGPGRTRACARVPGDPHACSGRSMSRTASVAARRSLLMRAGSRAARAIAPTTHVRQAMIFRQGGPLAAGRLPAVSPDLRHSTWSATTAATSRSAPAQARTPSIKPDKSPSARRDRPPP